MEFILILLVPLGVWIFSTLFKGDGNRPGPGGANRAPVQRRPVNDLDRFLAEARRRREAGERGAPPAGPEMQQRSPAPQREMRPAQPVERRSPRPQSSPRRRTVEMAPTPKTARAPILLEPVAEAPAPSFPQLPTPMAEPVAVESPPESADSASPPAAVRLAGVPQPPSLVLAQLTELLRSPRSAGVAYVLKEIFEPPLSRRRR